MNILIAVAAKRRSANCLLCRCSMFRIKLTLKNPRTERTHTHGGIRNKKKNGKNGPYAMHNEEGARTFAEEENAMCMVSVGGCYVICDPVLADLTDYLAD